MFPDTFLPKTILLICYVFSPVAATMRRFAMVLLWHPSSMQLLLFLSFFTATFGTTPVKHSIERATREKAKANGCNSEECRVIYRETEAESRKREIGKKGYGKNVCGTII